MRYKARKGSPVCPIVVRRGSMSARTGVVIRRAASSDHEPALALMSEAFALSLLAPTVHTMVASLPNGCMLVAVADGAILGTGGAVCFGRTGWIGGITVGPSARGRG